MHPVLLAPWRRFTDKTGMASLRDKDSHSGVVADSSPELKNFKSFTRSKTLKLNFTRRKTFQTFEIFHASDRKVEMCRKM